MASFTRFISELRSTLNRIFPVSSTITTILGRWTVSHTPQQRTTTTAATPAATTTTTSPTTPHTPTSHRSTPAPTTTTTVPTSITATASNNRGARTRNRQRRRSSSRRRTRTTTMTTSTANMTPFPIMNLPTELRLTIFEHCTPTSSSTSTKNWKTFHSLLLVSKTIQHEAYISCLPRIPIGLWNKKSIESFWLLLDRKPELGWFVCYLWIGTGWFDDEEIKWAVEIIRSAKRLKSLACSDFIFSKVVEVDIGTAVVEEEGVGEKKSGRVIGSKKLAGTCTRVSLMNIEKKLNYIVPQVTHLRVCAAMGILLEENGTKNRFPNLQNLSFNLPLQDGSEEEQALLAAKQSVDVFRKLDVVTTIGRDIKRSSRRGLGIKSYRQVEKVWEGEGEGEKGREEEEKKKGDLNLFKIVFPAKWTEWDVWSADSGGKGIWDCSRVPAST